MIKDYLQRIHPVPDDILDEYLSLWEPFELKKKQMINTPGQTERYSYLVLQGYQKSYYLQDGKQHIIAFTYPPSFTGIPESFLRQQPSKYFLETMTDSRFLRLSYDKHLDTMQRWREIETLYRKFIELVLVGFAERYYWLMAHDIETRFRDFWSRSPHLVNQIPHKDLASYLRIDPTNFSKLLSSVKT